MHGASVSVCVKFEELLSLKLRNELFSVEHLCVFTYRLNDFIILSLKTIFEMHQASLNGSVRHLSVTKTCDYFLGIGRCPFLSQNVNNDPQICKY